MALAECGEPARCAMVSIQDRAVAPMVDESAGRVLFGRPAGSCFGTAGEITVIGVLAACGARPGDSNSVVYFWDVAPRAHSGNVTEEATVSAFNAMMSGVSQMGACRLCRKIGEASAPRSAGCSKMNSAPAVCAARSRAAVRRTISLACTSSRWWLLCRHCRQPCHVVSVTYRGGGPPSAASSQ
eukprot:2006816-Pleurochrysis_carterae.AAC.4